MERESGYYWVKQYSHSDWEIAQWCMTGNPHMGGWFQFTWDIDNVSETVFEIDERRIVRVKHFENFIREPYVPEISPLSAKDLELLDKAIIEAIKQSILEFKPLDVKNGEKD